MVLVGTVRLGRTGTVKGLFKMCLPSTRMCSWYRPLPTTQPGQNLQLVDGISDGEDSEVSRTSQQVANPGAAIQSAQTGTQHVSELLVGSLYRC